MKVVRKPYWRELRKLDQGVRQSFRRRGDQLDIMQSGRILLHLGFQDAEYVGRLSPPKYEKMTGTYFLLKNETHEIEPCKDLKEAKWLASEIAKETGEHFTILKWVADVVPFSVNPKNIKSKAK